MMTRWLNAIHSSQFSICIIWKEEWTKTKQENSTVIQQMFHSHVINRMALSSFVITLVDVEVTRGDDRINE